MEEKKRKTIRVVKNLNDADLLISEIREAMESIRKEEEKLNKDISDLKSNAQTTVDEFVEKIKKDVDGIFIYAEKNRQKLTQGKTKTVETLSGKFSWRLTSNVILTDKEKAVVARLEKAGLKKLIKITITKKVNKKLVSSRKDEIVDIKGLEVETAERFSVTPNKVKLSEKEVEMLTR